MLDRRVRPDLGVRRRARPTRSPTRAGCSPRCRRSGSSRPRDLWPNHVVSSDPTDFPETAGPEVAGRAMLVRAARPVRLECIARGYLFGSAWSRVRGARHGVRPDAARRACARPSGCPSRSSRRRRRPRRATTSRSTDAEAAALVGDDVLRAAPRPRRCAIYEFAAGARCGAGRDPRRHEARVRDDRRRAAGDRRDAHARLVALLAGRATTRSAASPPSFDKQFVRDHYLDARVGPGAARAAAARRR